jgi:hypothetical protein
VIVQGRYEIHGEDGLVGGEVFHLRGHAIEIESDRAGAVPSRRKIRISLDSARDPVEVEVDLEGEANATRLRLRIDRGGRSARWLVQPPTGATLSRLLPFDAETEIDFPSPLFTFVTVGRLRLRPGERRDVAVVRGLFPSLMPDLGRLRYRRLPDVEIVAGMGGPLVAADYVVEGLEGGSFESRFQTNLLGLPLRVRAQGASGAEEYRLVA